ncbi:MAG: hypothetical protein QOJ42_3419 [Acidobacteriaceae bacterium]|nr:hypothetical protein [Acidobacteriaceae bacterium]
MVRVLLEVSKNSGVSLHSRYADQCAMPNHSVAVRHIPPQRQDDWGESLPQCVRLFDLLRALPKMRQTGDAEPRSAGRFNDETPPSKEPQHGPLSA